VGIVVQLDYETQRPREESGAPFWWTYIATSLVGVIAGGIVADAIKMAWKGTHSDGGIYIICAIAVVLEVPLLMLLRGIFGARKFGVRYAALFGLMSGPVVTVLLFLLAILDVW
jgi:hypothetical protein